MKRHKQQSRVRERTTFVVRTRPGHRNQGLVSVEGRIFHCALGPGGIRARKVEGDGATPLGRLILDRVLYRADRLPRPATAMPVRPVGKRDGWCDASGDRNYNRPVSLPYPARSETLSRDDILYNIVIITSYNVCPRMRGRGSAIFIHIARERLLPTQGCIALSTADLLQILKVCGRRAVFDILG
ncbi:MAG: L,D-transpeptidase family protein [Pseudomonadota bacterium]